MDAGARALRASLARMCPRRAADLLSEAGLPPEEAYCVYQRDVRGRSVLEIAGELHLSPETVKRRRRAAFRKLQDHSAYRDG